MAIVRIAHWRAVGIVLCGTLGIDHAIRRIDAVIKALIKFERFAQWLT